MPRNSELPDFEKGVIVGYHRNGRFFRDISSELNVAKPTMAFWLIHLLFPDYNRGRIRRHAGKRADPVFVNAGHTGPQLGVMVWGAISFDICIPLVVFRGTLTAQRYIDEILRTVWLPFLLQYSGLIFQLDSAKIHKVSAAVNDLTACQTLPWPARSLELSSIEHDWDMMGI
ncbi:transposable element Tc1 transposase [Trichonephila clavipes]|nr:transposable element Tc1 transposase [Trichonephila clavipes]